MCKTHSIRAAVVRNPGGPFVLENASLSAPRRGEVLVRVVATGMCHTDMVIRDQLYPVPLPIILGHEGSGVIETVGEGVETVVPGDHVVLTFLPCGQCRACLEGAPASCENFNAHNFAGARPDGSHACATPGGEAIHDRFFGQSSFATHAIADAQNVVKVRKDAPLELLGPLGCGIQTGAGAVLNALPVKAGSSFAVFGSGAVGLSAVMAARVAGATTIIACDIVPSRLELALEIGATHVVNSREADPVAAIHAITGGGADVALDTTGATGVIRSAIDAIRARGTCGVVGASKPGAEILVDANAFMQNCKRLRGIVEGDSVPQIFIPQLVDLYMQGRFPFDRLVKFYPFDQINDAAHDSEQGGTIKPIIRISAS